MEAVSEHKSPIPAPATFAQSTTRRARGVRHGLSLVELSIVILVLGILFSVIFGVFFGVARITQEASPTSLQKQEALLALENMRSSISQAYFHRDIKQLVFVGIHAGGKESGRDRLTFAAVHQGAKMLGVPAVREVSFYIKETNAQDGTGTLIRREDQTVDKEPGTGGSHYPLVKNVKSLHFRYTLNARDWRDKWHHENLRRIPRLVQIRMLVKIGNRIQRFETLAYTGLYMN